MRPADTPAMSEPVDNAARIDAIDPRRSVIVQAPAGSGKTSLLVKRFLGLLGQVENPEEILAITFTRKATAEMRERVLNALRDPDDVSGRMARENDGQRGWQLQKNMQRIRIQTIDSLCSELVRRMPWSSRFGAPPKLVDDASNLYQQAASLTLDRIEDQNDPEIAGACSALIHLLDSNRQTAVDLLAAMLKNRDQWMRSLGQFDRSHVEGWWQQTIEQTLEDCNGKLSPHMRAELARLSRYAAEKLNHYRTTNPGYPESPLDQCIDLEKFPDCHQEEVAYWRGIAAVLLTKSNTPFSKVDKRQGFPVDDNFQREQKTAILSLINEVRESPALLKAWQRITRLPDGTFSDEQWRYAEALLKLLPVVAAELRVIFNQRNEADYTELAQRADMALGEPERPTDLALALDYRLQHLLVDEFQDTSHGQVELLGKLVAGWTGEDGRSVFLVGDPMQSIYRFREAEVANFLHTQDHGIGAVRPDKKVLECNFRSSQQLVDWFNKVFRQVMPARSDILSGAVEYTGAQAFNQGVTGSIAEVHAAIDRDSETEAREIANIIEATLQGFDKDGEDKVAVLGRTRKNLDALVSVLDQRGIPYQGVKLHKLAERQSIQDLLALTLALLDPADRNSWLGLLRGPWLGATLEELSLLCESRKDQSVLALLKEVHGVDGIHPERQQQFRKITAILEQGIRQRGELPIHINLEACWLRLGGPAMVDQADLANCGCFIQMVEKLCAEGTPVNRLSLVEAMQELYADSGSEARLQLLTIHAAKGLEFDTVILPGLHQQPGNSDRPLLQWKTYPDRILIAPRASSAENGNRHYDMLGEINREHQHNELCRLLYVACTRARKRLHLFASVGFREEKAGPQLKTPPGNSLLEILWPAVEAEFRDALGDYVEPEQNATRATREEEPLLVQCPADWRLPGLDPGIEFRGNTTTAAATEQIDYDWVRNIARVAGIVTHQTLQEIENVGWDHWVASDPGDRQRTLWRNRLVRHGLTGAELDQAMSQVNTTLEKAREDPAAAWIFSSSHSEVRTEWPLTGVINGVIRHVVLDRSFVDADGIRWVVDFKTSRHDNRFDVGQFLEQEKQRYRHTMDTYAAILANLDDRPIKTALYYPALQALVKLDD